MKRSSPARRVLPALGSIVLLLAAACAPQAEPGVPAPAGRAEAAAPAGEATDSAVIAAALAGFHRALAAGDSAAVLDLLTPDAVILEMGEIETKEEYRGHHLPSDIAFAQAVQSERGPVRVVVRGDAAWASSTSIARGEFRGRPVNSQTAELAVLTRTPEGWRISAIHWSSRQLRQ